MNTKLSFKNPPWFVLVGLLLPLMSIGNSLTNDSIMAQYSVYKADSLIQANAGNPDFVILDVRTAAEYNPSHLVGAINRDFYNPSFSTIINQLPKNKLYVIYCGSGGRSGQTFTLMASLGFPSIINMLGGMASWNAAALPTTAAFAPLLMAVSDTLLPLDTLFIGNSDTLTFTITNRANDTLKFSCITSLTGTEFNTDFDTAFTLTGPFDYSFHIIYQPTDTLNDSLVFRIESNGGIVQFHVLRTATFPLGITDNIPGQSSVRVRNYPNPFTSSTCIEFELQQDEPITVSFVNGYGRKTAEFFHQGKKGLNSVIWDASLIPAGIYFGIIRGNNWNTSLKIIRQ